MKKEPQGDTLDPVKPQNSITFGEFAHQVIAEQFDRIIKQEKRVLADKDPEHLHQMRVGTRRLRTALQVFDSAIHLPAIASAKQLRNLARVLGAVRDLDVQIAGLKNDYHPNLDKREQKQLKQVLASLQEQRTVAFADMEKALTGNSYKKLKSAYKSWLDQPQYTAVAQLPITLLLPDVLSPLLSELLLHPGWLISTEQITPHNSEVLHDLRKVCKHVRYQTEFFTPFYGEDFSQWIKEVKQIQDDLGAFQDIQVLRELLTNELGSKVRLPKMDETIQQNQGKALSNWEEIRQKYLDEGFRYHLHQMLLRPGTDSAKVHPELLDDKAIAS